VIATYDIKHKIIPDPFVYTFALIALLSQIFGGASWIHIPSVSTLLAGPLLALPFALIWLISKGTWMGLGDAKLVLGIGWLLGLYSGVNAIVLAFWIAAAVSVIWLILTSKEFKAKTEVPFGPYLIIGMYLVLFFEVSVIDIHILRDLVLSYI
jgi:prepilin signal peptidase PulO-like enzyme (type II secretory pathway)